MCLCMEKLNEISPNQIYEIILESVDAYSYKLALRFSTKTTTIKKITITIITITR